MLGSLGWQELAIILLIVLVLFGVGRVSGLGRELGGSIKEFRRAVKDEDDENERDSQTLNTRNDDEPAAQAPANRSSDSKPSQGSQGTKPPSVF